MAPKKGGSWGEALMTGTAVFSALKAKDFQGFLISFVKYSIVIVALGALVWVVLGLLGVVSLERFSVPLAPSKEGDEKMVTPAGNVIMY